jgi:hypothetical protein
MSPRYISFTFFSCEIGATSCNDYKDHGITCFPTSKIKIIMFAKFDLWMSKGGANTFALVINYLNEAWTPRHATIGLFEVHETSGGAMVL